MSGRGLTAEAEALVDTSIDGSGRYGGHHWPACNGFVDDEWSKCDCGLVQAAFDIEAAAAREALEAVLEPVANAIYRALRAPSTIDETRYFDSLLAVDAAKLALGLDDIGGDGADG